MTRDEQIQSAYEMISHAFQAVRLEDQARDRALEDGKAFEHAQTIAKGAITALATRIVDGPQIPDVPYRSTRAALAGESLEQLSSHSSPAESEPLAGRKMGGREIRAESPL